MNVERPYTEYVVCIKKKIKKIYILSPGSNYRSIAAERLNQAFLTRSAILSAMWIVMKCTQWVMPGP